jgi:hypothetical protein
MIFRAILLALLQSFASRQIGFLTLNRLSHSLLSHAGDVRQIVPHGQR